MLKNIKKIINLDNPFRLSYHKLRAIIANFYYGFPSKDMIIIGVTGTNGKTTTCNIIAKGLIDIGKKIFMFSTINIIVGDKEYINNTKMTSPDVFELQKYLKKAKQQNCEIAIIETASHGIKMHRIRGLEYDYAILTNISREHLDLHKTMEDYVATKLKLFSNLISYKRKKGVKKVAVINGNSKYVDLFLAETFDSLYIYGKNNAFDLRANNIRKEGLITKFEIKVAGDNIKIETKLMGDFNISNILAAVGVFISFGIHGKKINQIIKKIDSIPGRMDIVENTEGLNIIVDYAHSEDALKKIFETIKGFKDIGKIITVFGATGDRDKTKRSSMGNIVSKYSDIVILTQDDDYSEKTENIIKDILPGIKRKQGEDFWIISSRKEAIQSAIMKANKNDMILVAGKGDERVMVTNNGFIKWHDKTIIKNILKSLNDNKIIN